MKYLPFILLAIFPDGFQLPIRATSPSTCHDAQEALAVGFWKVEEPLHGRAIVFKCLPGNLFSDRELCIINFNC